jgi:acetylornithine deacetylase
MTSLFSFVRQIIDIPSITGQEFDLARFIERHVSERGFRTELQEVEESRLNVFARISDETRLVFCTHLDTVPPFFPSGEDEDYIYGRGACDAKGILGAMITAAEQLRDEGIDTLGLLFVVGEELDSIGAKAANRLRSNSRYVVVGEPTENRLASGHKGTFNFVLKAEGRAAHSAYPHLGDSAIDRLLGTLDAIRRADWGESDVLGRATVNIGKLSGGIAANIIAPEAEANVYVRIVGKVSEAEDKLEEILDGETKLTQHFIAKSDAVFCEVLPGFEVAPVAFGTDIPSLVSFGRPLLIGPGSIHDAHTVHEKIGKTQLLEAVDLYRRIAKILLGGKS